MLVLVLDLLKTLSILPLLVGIVRSRHCDMVLVDEKIVSTLEKAEERSCLLSRYI
jgi:hypothetical protein